MRHGDSCVMYQQTGVMDKQANSFLGQAGNEKRAKTIFRDDISIIPRAVKQSSVILSPAIDHPEQIHVTAQGL